MANPYRGEIGIVLGDKTICIRPTFEAIVAAEKELGSVVGLAMDAADGKVGFAAMALFLWYLIGTPEDSRPEQEDFGKDLLALGIAKVAEIFRDVLTLILNGRPDTP